jgi:hypothetical protein
MNRTLITSLALLTLPAAVRAEDVALRQCRNIGHPVARLACYDALSLPPAPAASASSTAAGALEGQFGLPAPSERVQELVTRFEGSFEGWRANERIRLANGQVWQVIDGSTGVYELKSPQVTIRRGALGRFVLDIEGAAKRPGVRRVE